jgi:hypothetical protein
MLTIKKNRKENREKKEMYRWSQNRKLEKKKRNAQNRRLGKKKKKKTRD